MNREWTLMAANNLIQADEVYRIIGAAFSVLRELGHGLHEKPYENALVVELGLCGISCDQQKRFSVLYKTCRSLSLFPI